jgi:hypothetical protein
MNADNSCSKRLSAGTEKVVKNKKRGTIKQPGIISFDAK